MAEAGAASFDVSEFASVRLPNDDLVPETSPTDDIKALSSSPFTAVVVFPEPERVSVVAALTSLAVPFAPANAFGWTRFAALWATHGPSRYVRLPSNGRARLYGFETDPAVLPTVPGVYVEATSSAMEEVAKIPQVKVHVLLPTEKLWGKAATGPFEVDPKVFSLFGEFIQYPSNQVLQSTLHTGKESNWFSADESTPLFVVDKPTVADRPPFFTLILRLDPKRIKDLTMVSSALRYLSELPTALRVGVVNLELHEFHRFGYSPEYSTLRPRDPQIPTRQETHPTRTK